MVRARFIVDRIVAPLLTARVPLGRLNRNVTQKKLDLFQRAPCGMAQARAGPATIVDTRGRKQYPHHAHHREKCATTDKQMDRILATLADPQRAPIFVHSRRGADRSGVVIACYRIVHDGWTNAQPMQEAHEQGFSGLEVVMRRYVRHYKPQPAMVSR
jgi:hypothetical protein